MKIMRFLLQFLGELDLPSITHMGFDFITPREQHFPILTRIQSCFTTNFTSWNYWKWKNYWLFIETLVVSAGNSIWSAYGVSTRTPGLDFLPRKTRINCLLCLKTRPHAELNRFENPLLFNPLSNNVLQDVKMITYEKKRYRMLWFIWKLLAIF